MIPLSDFKKRTTMEIKPIDTKAPVNYPNLNTYQKNRHRFIKTLAKGIGVTALGAAMLLTAIKKKLKGSHMKRAKQTETFNALGLLAAMCYHVPDRRN